MINEKRRPHDDGASFSAAAGSSGNLSNIRQQGQEFLSASDGAIDGALSRNSANFNQSARQQGGQ